MKRMWFPENERTRKFIAKVEKKKLAKLGRKQKKAF